MPSKVCFEDVQEGTEIPPLVKSITLLQMNMYSAATWSFYRIHWDTLFSQQLGYRDASVHGPLLGVYLAQMLTDWIGIDGTIKRLGYSNRRASFPGDTLTCKGRVTGKHTKDGENLVDCEIWVENQNGENLAPGTATVALPSRG
jgi:hydroxyacyl-ACP dehydratase HTD2-like protein with hotdog domain